MSTNITDTVRALVSDATLLVKQEVSLAKAEAEEKFEQVQTGLIAIVSGLLIAFVALLVLVEALVVALANIMPPSLAALLVGVILAVVAFFAVKKGQDNLSVKNLKPRRTMNAVREDAETLKEAV
ncbi:phage holin family protein [Ahrensia sp. R2A130]|uniref:phage holin family protein n=1 Tax=Ahrensia sp. R2A130 TaxID=744979 RepID=UPI0001E0A493|nr:phage holin family protein [Ahrensia sp. R2A130]EFL88626.1 nutrient deprivation-induced protein [Ahrensia sp. R2A130]